MRDLNFFKVRILINFHLLDFNTHKINIKKVQKTENFMEQM